MLIQVVGKKRYRFAEILCDRKMVQAYTGCAHRKYIGVSTNAILILKITVSEVRAQGP